MSLIQIYASYFKANMSSMFGDTTKVTYVDATLVE